MPRGHPTVNGVRQQRCMGCYRVTTCRRVYPVVRVCPACEVIMLGQQAVLPGLLDIEVKAGELPGPAKSLAEAVCRVMAAVSYVQKDKGQDGKGLPYKYVSVEAVIDKLRPEMIRQGLVLLPAGVEVLHQGEHGRQVHLRVRYTFDLIHHPSGQTRPVVVVGEGMDVGDKAGNKCMTAARKYAMVMAFNIETGTDPNDPNDPRR